VVDLPKRLELEDIEKYAIVSNPQISPNAENICFMVTKHRLKDNDYPTNLWLADRTSGDTQQFTSGGTDTSSVCSRDGKQIAFISKRTLKEDEPGNELWTIDIDGGEAQYVHKRKTGIGNVRWSPDGQKILFLSPVPTQEEEEGVRVIQGLPIYFDGFNYIYNWRKHLFVLDLATKEVKQLTEGNKDIYYAEFSNDGTQIAYVAEEGNRRTFGMYITDLFLIPVDGGSAKKIIPSKMRVGAITWSPDDQYLAYSGSDHKIGGPTHSNVFVVSIAGESPKNMTESLGLTIQPSVYCDVEGPFTPMQGPVWHGNHVYFVVCEGGAVRIYRVSHPDGTIEPVVSGDIRVSTFSIARDVIAFSRSTPTEPPELWVKEGNTIKSLTAFNNWAQEYQHVTPEHFEFTASDGASVEGWVMKPLDMEPSKKYPAILNVHGGPKSTWGFGYLHELQFMVTNGYAIIIVNPRGSGGYSEEFADIRSRYGEESYTDLMEAVDQVLANNPEIDPERLGITGISYGGFMTNWVVGHTDRFKAAVTQASICNWISFFGVSDIGFRFTPDQIGRDINADPWTHEEAYLKQSPLRYMKNVKTPT